jgi:hypothetical protein
MALTVRERHPYHKGDILQVLLRKEEEALYIEKQFM